jgi:antitoxin component of MazEF toxin-antitoxin module
MVHAPTPPPEDAPMHALKVTQIGHSPGLILPKKVLAPLKLQKSDVLHLSDSPNGVRLNQNVPAFDAQMDAARLRMKARRAMLRGHLEARP